jgi:signal transduction histidine kinase
MPGPAPQKTSFVRSSVAFLAIGLFALLSIVGTTIWLVERSQVYFNDVIRARDLRSAATEFRTALLSAESSQRGFIMTGNEIYLAPYDSNKALALRQIDTLIALSPQPNVVSASQRLAALAGEKFREMDRTIVLKRAGQDAELQADIRTNRGKALMDEVNVFSSGIIRVADEKLTQGVSEERDNAAMLRLVSIVAGFVIAVVVGGAMLSGLRYTRKLDEARNLVEQRVRERTAELAQANDEIKRFAHIVSHDLRAPLVNIMGFTSELEAGMKAVRQVVERDISADAAARQARTAAVEDMPEAIGFIRSSTAKMNNLISAILKLSREGQRKLVPEDVDLDRMARASAATIQHQLTESGGIIAIDIPLPPIRTDRLSVEQIFGNLLDNAVKYRAPDRPVRIEVRGTADGDGVEITVSDNGRGIAEQDQARVFELFKRSGAPDRPGEGIGLAYVKTMVHNLGGDISLTSELGAGTTFRIRLPANLPV